MGLGMGNVMERLKGLGYAGVHGMTRGMQMWGSRLALGRGLGRAEEEE